MKTEVWLLTILLVWLVLQSPSPALPRLAIPLEPLRRSIAELHPSDPALAEWEARAAAVQHTLATSPAAQQLPPQSPPHADLLGLGLQAESSDVNFASPPRHSAPASCYGASHPATPAEQLVATNLPNVWGGAASPQPHARRDLMDLLRSRAEGLGAAAQLQPAAAVPEVQQPGSRERQGSGTGQVPAEGPGPVAGEQQETGAVAAQQQQQPASAPQQLVQRAGVQAAASPDSAAEQMELDENRSSNALEQPPQQQQAPRAQSRRASPIKSPVKRTTISVQHLLAKKRASPAKKRAQQQERQPQRLQPKQQLRRQQPAPRVQDRQALLRQAQLELEKAKLEAASLARRPSSSASNNVPRAAQGARPTVAAAAAAGPGAAGDG